MAAGGFAVWVRATLTSFSSGSRFRIIAQCLRPSRRRVDTPPPPVLTISAHAVQFALPVFRRARQTSPAPGSVSRLRLRAPQVRVARRRAGNRAQPRGVGVETLHAGRGRGLLADRRRLPVPLLRSRDSSRPGSSPPPGASGPQRARRDTDLAGADGRRHRARLPRIRPGSGAVARRGQAGHARPRPRLRARPRARHRRTSRRGSHPGHQLSQQSYGDRPVGDDARRDAGQTR